jgi:hypothetical protein
VLLKALDALKEYEEAVADIQEGVEDELAGRLQPLRQVDAEIRQELGFVK